MADVITCDASELVSELLLGMRLHGVQFRSIEIASSSGVGFSNPVGRAQFHFVGRGPVWLRGPEATLHALKTGDALLIPNGGPHAMLSAPATPACEIKTFDPADDDGEEHGHAAPVNTADSAVIFSCCMELQLGGMQSLVAEMPSVMRVDTILESSPEIRPMLDAMKRESMRQQAGHAGILARLAEVVAALILRGWIATGCGNATGWLSALSDPRLSKAIVMMHRHPGRQWSVASLAKEVGNSRSVFAQRFLLATGVSPLRYLTELRMRLAFQRLKNVHQPIEAVAIDLGYGSLAAFSRAFKRYTGISPGAVRGADDNSS